MNWEEMTPRGWDALVAEHIYGREPLLGRHGLHENGDIEYSWGYPHGHNTAPNYSTNASVADEMENELERQGLDSIYLVKLSQIVGANPIVALGTATPEQRCRAALRAKGINV